jgi:hypothetical protein
MPTEYPDAPPESQSPEESPQRFAVAFLAMALRLAGDKLSGPRLAALESVKPA